MNKDIDRIAIATDLLVFAVTTGEAKTVRSLSDKNLSILLVKRTKEPFKDKWVLPGGFVKADETLDEAANRVLYKETNLKNIFNEQLYTFSRVDRDLRERVISSAYLSLIDKTRIKDKLGDDASWFNIHVEELKTKVKVVFENDDTSFSVSLKKEIVDKSSRRYQYTIIDNDYIGFDHPEIIMVGLDRLRNKVEDTDIIFNIMPDYFTLGELQQIYEIILGKKLLDPAFRRIIEPKVEKTDKTIKTGGHRPSVMFKYKNK